MKTKIKATIYFDTTKEHPDTNGKVNKGMKFTDIYYVENDLIDYEYIKNDLALIAGGGYTTKTITNVRFNISINK